MTQHRTREEQIHALASNLAGVRCITAFERASAERQVLAIENRVRAELQAENERLREALRRIMELPLNMKSGSNLRIAQKLAAACAVPVANPHPGRTDRDRLDAMADHGWKLQAAQDKAWHVLDMRSQFVAEGDSARTAINAAMDREGRGDE